MEKKKYFIDTVLQKEKQRNILMQEIYRNRILDLPKGTLFIRKINGRKYCYLRYRSGKKVIQNYAGTIEKEQILRTQIAERNHLIELVEMLEEEYKRIIKMEVIK